MSCIQAGTRAGQAVPKIRCVGPVPPSSRLHPVAVTLQRYTTQEIILQDYRIPPKVRAATGSLLTPTHFTWGSGWRWDLGHGWVTWWGEAVGIIWDRIPSLHPLPVS